MTIADQSNQTDPGVAARLEQFVRVVGEISDDPYFDRDVHLFEAGYVDSLGVIRLIDYLEATYRLTFTQDELFSPEFTTINGISGIVEARLAAASSS